LHFSGKVFNGQEYRKEFASALVLRLTPTFSGWNIGVIPSVPCEPDEDWASVINPPYRGYNALLLDSSYGTTAREAVSYSPRVFHFLLSCGDYKRERRRLEIVLWPYTHSKKVSDDALANLGTSRHGTIKFTILQSKISPADEDVAGRNFGKIDWLRFKVDVSLPPRNRTAKK
jgi:hypothetical protein